MFLIKQALPITLLVISCFSSSANANFEQKKKQALDASRAAVANIKKQCKKNIPISIDWSSFQANENDLVMIPNALKQLSLLMSDNYSEIQKVGRCNELKNIRMVYNKKTNKALNLGLLTLVGNSGSQTFTKEDFSKMFEEAMGFSQDKAKLTTGLQRDATIIKKVCEKNIDIKIDWSSVKNQVRQNVSYLSMVINQTRNSFVDLQQKQSHEKACEATNQIIFGLAFEPFIELQNGILKNYTTKGTDSVNGSIALMPLLQKGPFTRVTPTNLAKSSTSSGSNRAPASAERDKTELERDLENDAGDVKNDVKNEARQKAKNKVKDSIKDSLFKGF